MLCFKTTNSDWICREAANEGALFQNRAGTRLEMVLLSENIKLMIHDSLLLPETLPVFFLSLFQNYLLEK